LGPCVHVRAIDAIRCQTGAGMSETPLASVYFGSHCVGEIMDRGPKGFEAVGQGGTSHGLFNSLKEAVVALQKIAMREGR
jgi:hypothetical protein